MTDLLEFQVPQVAEQIIGRHVVGHEEVDPPVVVEIGGDDAEAAPVVVDDSGRRGDVDEMAAVVAEQMIRPRGKAQRQAGDVAVRRPGVAAEGGMLGIPGQVMADIQVEVAVAVEVGERR